MNISNASLFVVGWFGLILAATFRLFSFSYFWWDDLNNFFLVQKSSAANILWHVLNPLAQSPPEASFRPLGMLWYRLFWVTFDLSPLPYRLFQWGLHCVNVALLYLLLKELLRSRFAAAFGAMLLVYQAVYFELYWNFWAIFELLSAQLMLLALLTYLKRGTTMLGILLVSAAYFLANQGKEMAITLPAILILLEFTVGHQGSPTEHPSIKSSKQCPLEIVELRRIAKSVALPALIGLLFVYAKLTTFAGMQMIGNYDPTFPYYRNYSPVSILESFSWYFDALFHIHLESITWLVLLVSATALLIKFKSSAGQFFLGYILISFLPVVILPNHRFAYYWYIPCFGVIGLAALVMKYVAGATTRSLTPTAASVLGALFIGFVGAGNYLLQSHLDRYSRAWAAGVSAETRSFIEGLRALPPPALNETIYFNSVPQYFGPIQTKSAAQVAFRRTDLEVSITRDFLPDAQYRVSFENSVVHKEP